MELVTWTNSVCVEPIIKNGFNTSYKRCLENKWPISHIGDRVHVYGEVVCHPCNGVAKNYGLRMGDDQNSLSFVVGLVLYPTEGLTYSNGDSLLIDKDIKNYTDQAIVAWDWYTHKEHPKKYIEFQFWKPNVRIVYIYVEKYDIDKAISMKLNKYAPLMYMEDIVDESCRISRIEKFIKQDYNY